MENLSGDGRKPKTKKVYHHDNPDKRNQLTRITEEPETVVSMDDGQEMPGTIIVDGKEVKLTTEKPLPKPPELKNAVEYWWEKD